MNVTRRNFLAGTGIAATAVLAGCGSSNGSSDGASASGEKTYKIGVVQLTEHAALDASNEGFVEAVNASGLSVSIDQQNAQNDQSACQTIASKFVGDGVDLIFAIATPAAQAAAGATTEIPIVAPPSPTSPPLAWSRITTSPVPTSPAPPTSRPSPSSSR